MVFTTIIFKQMTEFKNSWQPPEIRIQKKEYRETFTNYTKVKRGWKYKKRKTKKETAFDKLSDHKTLRIIYTNM